MKRVISITLFAALLATLVLSLVSCSSYNGIEKNFTKNGYSVVDLSEESNSTANTIVTDLDDMEVSFTTHLLKKDGTIGGFVLILEFSASEDIDKVLDEEGSETLRGLLKDMQKSDYVNGNCLLVPLTLLYVDEAVELFKQ